MASIDLVQFGQSIGRARYEELRDGRILIPPDAHVDKLRRAVPKLDWQWIDEFGIRGWTISYADGIIIWGRQWFISAPLTAGGHVLNARDYEVDIATVASRTWPLTAAALRDDEWNTTSPAKFALRVLALQGQGPCPRHGFWAASVWGNETQTISRVLPC